MVCFWALAGIAQSPPPPLLPPAANFSFPAKQTLNYAVDWRVFPAGQATFHLEQAGTLPHLIATGEAVGALHLRFRGNDRFASCLNRTTSCSSALAQHLP